MKQDVQNQQTKRGNPYVGFLWVILIVLLLNGLIFPKLSKQKIISTDYGSFIEKVDSGRVKDVMIKSSQIFFTAVDKNGETNTFQTGETNDPQLVERLLDADSPNENGKIAFNQIVPEENSPILNFLLMWILPGLIFYIIWRQTSKTIQSRMGTGGNFMSFGNSGAKIYADADIKTTFADVAGQEEAKETLKEIVDFLHNPKKYTEIGASLPKGALLVGPPGTGKTLIARAVAGKSKVDDEVLDNLEEVLITSDVGVETTLKIIKRIEKRVAQDKYVNTQELNNILREEIAALLTENNTVDSEEFTVPEGKKPYVIMVVGVNGVGKTTTIGKLAYQFKKAGKKVYLGAADTFRAAAVEQLDIWGERVGVPVIKQKMGADPASVAFDTLSSAKANNADVVIIDTAGRLHNKIGLMNELTKIKNVMKKVVPDAPHEVLLVLDGSTGQNAFEQAKQFTLATEVTAMAITKLDGTAKGGVVIGISDQFKIPVRYIGLGEGMEDLQIFRRREFVDSLFGSTTEK